MSKRTAKRNIRDGFVKGDAPQAYEKVSVLFLDIVEFSRQKKSAEMIRAVVSLQRSLEVVLNKDFFWDEARRPNEIIPIPTGDGYAVAFHPVVDGKTILEIVNQIYHKLTTEEGLRVRFGISHGLHVVFVDLNKTLNLIGAGIIRAQRAMTIAEPNQILCTSEFAQDLAAEDPTSFQKLPGYWRVKNEDAFELYIYTSTFGKKENQVGIKATPDARFQTETKSISQ